MIIYLLKSCDRCRSVLARMRAAGHSPRVVDVRSDGLTLAQIKGFLAEFGEALVNRRSTTWRGLSEAERAEPAAELLARHPTLMKRPVIESGGKLYAGWDAEALDRALENAVRDHM